jgi:hypothetical protein
MPKPSVGVKVPTVSSKLTKPVSEKYGGGIGTASRATGVSKPSSVQPTAPSSKPNDSSNQPNFEDEIPADLLAQIYNEDLSEQAVSNLM